MRGEDASSAARAVSAVTVAIAEPRIDGRADPLRADAGGGRVAGRVVPVRARDGTARLGHASRGARRADAHGGASPGIRGGVGMPRPARRSDRSGAARRGRMGQRSARHRPPEARARPPLDGAAARDEGAMLAVDGAGRHGASGAPADGRRGLLRALRARRDVAAALASRGRGLGITSCCTCAPRPRRAGRRQRDRARERRTGVQALPDAARIRAARRVGRHARRSKPEPSPARSAARRWRTRRTWWWSGRGANRDPGRFCWAARRNSCLRRAHRRSW